MSAASININIWPSLAFLKYILSHFPIIHWCLYFSNIHNFFIVFFIPVTYFIIYIYFGFSLFTTTISLLWRYSSTKTWTLFSTKMMSGFSFMIFSKIFFIIALSFLINSSNLINDARESKSIEFSTINTLGWDKWLFILFVDVFFSNTMPFTNAWIPLLPSVNIVFTLTLLAISIPDSVLPSLTSTYILVSLAAFCARSLIFCFQTSLSRLNLSHSA